MKEVEENQKQKKVTQISMTEQPNPKVKKEKSSFHNNKLKRNISEALYIKQYRPSLNS